METDKKRRRLWPTIAVGIPAILILYVLSIGPVAWLLQELPIKDDSPICIAIAHFYSPIMLAVQNIPGADWLLLTYLDWFVEIDI